MNDILTAPTVINLTEVPTETAIALASISETVHIAITNLSIPGIHTIPVRFIDDVNDLIWSETEEPIRSRLLQGIERIIQN